MMNGRTPSPPSVPTSSSQQLPPACGARQLSKLKRFLTTLQQFGSDISPEIGERVRALVLGLVVSHAMFSNGNISLVKLSTSTSCYTFRSTENTRTQKMVITQIEINLENKNVNLICFSSWHNLS